MPALTTVERVLLKPIVAELGPFTTGGTMPEVAPPSVIGSVFVSKHKDFIDQVNALNHCFSRGEILRFSPDELEEHINVALQDNFIVEDGKTSRFCTGQVAWELKTRTQGYTYRKL